MLMNKQNTHILHHPLAALSEEDLHLITQLVLASGSLKDLATAYGVSYPTIRGRLDAVIARLRDAIAGRTPDPVANLLADLVQRGELTPSGARAVLETVRRTSGPDGQPGQPEPAAAPRTTAPPPLSPPMSSPTTPSSSSALRTGDTP